MRSSSDKMARTSLNTLGQFIERQIVLAVIGLILVQVTVTAVKSHLRPKFLGVTHPEQIHIAFGDTFQDIVIMWATKRDEVFSVEFAEIVEKMQTVEGERTELQQHSSRAAKYLHRVYLKQLKPGVKYFYRIIAKTGANSNIYSFTVPFDPKEKKVHTFMVFADMGQSANSMKFLTYEAASGKYEAVFHVGDIAYNLDLDEGLVGDNYLKHVEKFAAKVPYMTVPGDHEKYHNFGHYRYRFSMPQSPWPMKADRLYYSVDIGPVHFVTINTEVFYSGTTLEQDDQLAWLQNDLLELRKRRDQHPWLIVLGHKPLYSSKSDFPTNAKQDCSSMKDCAPRTKLEDIFYQEGVDIYISGHQHNYERTWPMFRGRVFQKHYNTPSAPFYIVNGAMGKMIISEKFVESNVWSAFSMDDPEKELYGRLQVLNGSHLMWDVFTATNNEEVDSVLVIRKVHGSYGKAADTAYEEMRKWREQPPAPLGWHPPQAKIVEEGVVTKFYRLPPSSRRFYLISACLSLLTALICLLLSSRVRRKICKKR